MWLRKKKKGFFKAIRNVTKIILLLSPVPHHKRLETAHRNYYMVGFV